MWLSEDVTEFVEEVSHQVRTRTSQYAGCPRRYGQAGPYYPSSVPSKRHCHAGEIPSDRPKRSKPLNTQYDVESYQWHRIAIQCEVLLFNANVHGTTWTKTGDAVSIGHYNTKAQPGSDENTGGRHDIISDEVMHGSRIEKSNKGAATNLNREPHRLAEVRLDASQCRQGYFTFNAGVRVVVEFRLNFDDEKTFTMVVDEELLITVVAYPLRMLFLELGSG